MRDVGIERVPCWDAERPEKFSLSVERVTLQTQLGIQLCLESRSSFFEGPCSS